MTTRTLACTLFALWSLVTVASAADQGTTYEAKTNGPGCFKEASIASSSECQTAAISLRFSGELHVGNWKHAPPGCHVGHPADGWAHVYFNENLSGKTGRPIYQSICRKINKALALETANPVTIVAPNRTEAPATTSQGVAPNRTEAPATTSQGYVWEERQTVFNNAQCPNMGANPGLSILDCKKKCDQTPSCSAINVRIGGSRMNRVCVLRACPFPVQNPNWKLSGFKSYFKKGYGGHGRATITTVRGDPDTGGSMVLETKYKINPTQNTIGTTTTKPKPKLWRDDGRCGNNYRADNEKPGQCDPTESENEKGPCCSSGGWCGNSTAHCLCPSCVNYAGDWSIGPSVCTNPTPLSDSWRHIDYDNRGDFNSFCDRSGSHSSYSNLSPGWYRFTGPAGNKLPTTPAPGGHPKFGKLICGTAATSYISSGSNPTMQDGIVTREVCFEYGDEGCWQKTTIKMAACRDVTGEYFVYELQQAPDCDFAYCAID